MPNPVLESIGRTPKWLIEDVLAGKYILDLGIVQGTDQTTVDVQHTVIPTVYGKGLGSGGSPDPVVTKKVEVVWAFPGNWTLQQGDIVLLLGLRAYVKTAYAKSPAKTDIGLSYTRETMKAVPLYSSVHGATITVDGSNLVHIKNAAASLYTAIQNFIQGVQGGTYGGSGAPGPFVDTTGKVSLALSQLGQIMGA